MDNQAVAQPGTVALEPPSTVLNPQTVPVTSGGGATSLSESAGDEGSVESVLETELARLKAEDGKTAEPKADEPKDKPEAKADEKADDKADDKAKVAKDDKAEAKPARERGQDGKFAKADKAQAEDATGDKGAPEKAATGQGEAERGRQSEGRQHYDPPSRFLPKEKEAWGNVPNVVKAAIARYTGEHETEVQQYRASHEEWTKLDRFQQMAKQHNTTIGEAMDRYTKLDGLLSSDPLEAIRQILGTRGITPEQYAQHVMQNPQAHQAPAPHAQQAQPDRQLVGHIQHLQSQLDEMRNEQTRTSVVEPFRTSHPRFDELHQDISFFLQSGKIPASMSPVERLEAAYDMAERINPSSMSAPMAKDQTSEAAEPARLAKPDAGKKSIRGALSDGADTETEEPEADLEKLLRKELRRMSA